MYRSIAAIATALLVAMSATGCSRKLRGNDLIGQYSAQIGNERQVLTLRNNWSYESKFYRNDKLVWQQSDHWGFGDEKVIDAAAITLARFRFGFAQYVKHGPGYWLVKPERTVFGKLELCFDPDLNDPCFVREYD